MLCPTTCCSGYPSLLFTLVDCDNHAVFAHHEHRIGHEIKGALYRSCGATSCWVRSLTACSSRVV